MNEIASSLWFSVSEAAHIGGLQSKTIRRGIESGKLSYKVVGNRYLINAESLIIWLLSSTKLRNKFMRQGFGQYVSAWSIATPLSGETKNTPS